MLAKLDRLFNRIYKISGYIAGLFLIFIAIFIIVGICSRIFGFYIRGLSEYSGYSMASASFLALAYTFHENGHIRISFLLEKANIRIRKYLEFSSLFIASFFSGYFAYYFTKMTWISYLLQEKSEGPDEILMWIPQSSTALGSIIFFICISHHFLKHIGKKND